MKHAEKSQEREARIGEGLSKPDQEEVERRSAIGPAVVHEAIRKEGEEELERPSSALAWSGLAAGMSMTFSLIGEGLIRSHLPDAAWRPLLVSFGYTLGFLIVVLGRQQLFTENTLTVILPLLTRRTLSSYIGVLRLWAVVLFANLVGVFLATLFVGISDVFPPDVKAAFAEIGQEAMQASPSLIFLKGIFAGWLIALMVWLLPAADAARVRIIIIVTYFVALGQFSHIIAGSSETLYLVVTGNVSMWECISKYMLPTLAGNTLGGVSLVAALNHAQVIAGKKRSADEDGSGG